MSPGPSDFSSVRIQRDGADVGNGNLEFAPTAHEGLSDQRCDFSGTGTAKRDEAGLLLREPWITVHAGFILSHSKELRPATRVALQLN